MNIKSNQAILVSAAFLIALAVPALAQSSTVQSPQKGNINAVQLSQKAGESAKGKGCGNGECKGKFKAFGKRPEGLKVGYARGPEGFRHHHGGTFGALRGQYALTDDQREKILSLKNQMIEQARPKFTDMFATERKLRDLMSEPSVDKAQVLTLQAQINSDKDTLSNMRLENKLSELNVLTDQQRQELRHSFLTKAVHAPRS